MKLKTAAIATVATVGIAVPLTMSVSALAESSDKPAALANDFYTDPNNNAFKWLEENPDSDNADEISSQIAEQAGANWYGTELDEPWDNTPVDEYVAAAADAGQTPILAAYNMYERDCGGESEGGASSPETYKTWIDEFATAIGDGEAVVVLEPDALPQLLDENCTDIDADTRKELLAYGAESLASNAPNALVYMDAGNAEWPGTAAEVATALTDSGVDDVQGYALNVSNHYTSAESDERAAEINAELGGDTPYIVDTSRNGSGKTDDSDDSWCNPVGATLGDASSADVEGGADAHLWVKQAGDSDGDCGYGEGVPAGEFDEKLAMALITGEYDE